MVIFLIFNLFETTGVDVEVLFLQEPTFTNACRAAADTTWVGTADLILDWTSTYETARMARDAWNDKQDKDQEYEQWLLETDPIRWGQYKNAPNE